jgi:glutamate-1-semialdehyde 2,1-aminomutase
MPSERDETIRQLTERELAVFEKRSPRSLALCQRAVHASLPLGVPTNVCALAPYPIAIAHGDGAWLTDIDDVRRCDYHAGFGTTVFGHSHPTITQAICEQAAKGVHFGAMHEPVVPWAEHLCSRYGLDWIRFSNSGTEATMDAVRLARAKTGRVKVAKIEGGYHGSHEVAFVSMNMALDDSAGPDHQPRPRLASEGVSARLLDEVAVMAFNDLDGARQTLAAGDVACVIVEPILMNVGTISPQPGYLQGLRDLCDEHGTLLIFDETKTGASVAWGGASELFGVTPHLRTLGKGIGGGLSCGALGDTDGSCFDLIEQFRVPHLGTFGGNPMVAAAGLAAMEDVLTPSAYEQLNEFGDSLRARLDRTIADTGLPAYTTGMGAKGCIVWVDERQHGRLRSYRDWARHYQQDLGFLTWVWMMNRGVFLAPGQDEQWTHTISHSQAEADVFAAAFEELAAQLAPVFS